MTRHRTGKFPWRSEPDAGEKMTLIFPTNHGQISCDIQLGQNIPESVSGCGIIAMFDLTSKRSFDRLTPLIDQQIKNNTPIVVCGNKYGSKNKQVHHNNISSLLKKHNYSFPYVDISVHTTYQIYNPFLLLLSRMTRHSDLFFY